MKPTGSPAAASRVWAISSAVLVLLLYSCSGAGTRSPLQTATPAVSMKGWELYSWQSEGSWHYALLMGTNREKGPQEIMNPDTRLDGLAAIKERLAQLAAGEVVIWMSANVEGMALPHEDTVSELTTYCKALGLQLHVIR